MVSKQDASKRLVEWKELEPEPESPFLDEAVYDLPTREEAWDSYEAEPEPGLETPFASAFAQAEQISSGFAAEEEMESEIELEELEGPGREPEEETGEEEGEFEDDPAHLDGGELGGSGQGVAAKPGRPSPGDPARRGADRAVGRSHRSQRAHPAHGRPGLRPADQDDGSVAPTGHLARAPALRSEA
jgi:hypothetical protein